MPEAQIREEVSSSTQLAWSVLFGENSLREADHRLLHSLQDDPETWGRLILDTWETFAALGGRAGGVRETGPRERPASATVTRVDPLHEDDDAQQRDVVTDEGRPSLARGNHHRAALPERAPAADTPPPAAAEATSAGDTAQSTPAVGAHPTADGAPRHRPPSSEPRTSDSAAAPAPTGELKTLDFFDPDEEDDDAPARGTVTVEEVKARLVELIVDVSGYPAEVFEDHLDLEVDLGIDSIKQVETLAKVREEYGLSMDENFLMRDYATIGKMAGYIVRRLADEA